MSTFSTLMFISGITSIIWVITMRYALVLRHRQKYPPIVSVENNVLGDSNIKKEETAVPWSILLRSSAFW